MASSLSIRAARTVSGAAGPFVTNPGSTASLLPRRGLSTTAPRFDETDRPVENATEKPPRWSYTPHRAKAPFSLHTGSTKPKFTVNNDPQRLDQFYISLLGDTGHKVLPEELKWLAVTHKSFDQGRRGFNDRLAFLGKRVVQLQTSLALVQNVPKPESGTATATEDEFGRMPFAHPALDGVNNLTDKMKHNYLDKMKLAMLAKRYGLQRVIRWNPKNPNHLAGSGIDLILAHTMYAIIGAISLEKGGHVANMVAQKRILLPLGLKIH